MPKTVSVKDMPKPFHTGSNLQPKPRKHPAILEYMEALLRDPAKRAVDVAVFTIDDGVTSSNRESVGGSLRSAAKKLGFKLQITWMPAEGALYVKSDGEYVPMSSEELAVRRIKQTANKELRRLRK